MASSTEAPFQPNAVLGISAIVLVMIIYAVNFVATRYSVTHGLNSFDLAALRYFVAGLVMLPFFYKMGLKNLGGIGWVKGFVLACLAGSPYMLVFFFGLNFAPASHGAVLNPGIVPSVVFLGMVFLGLQSFSIIRTVSLLLIAVGVTFVTASSFSLDGSVLFGDLLLLITGISWGIFTLLTKLWELKPIQSTAIVSVISMLYLPIYFLFFYKGFTSVSVTHVVLQTIFQGIVLSIGTLYLVTYAVQHIGVQLTSLFSPLVPVITTLIAIPLLGESPLFVQWLGIILVAFGLLSSSRLTTG